MSLNLTVVPQLSVTVRRDSQVTQLVHLESTGFFPVFQSFPVLLWLISFHIIHLSSSASSAPIVLVPIAPGLDLMPSSSLHFIIFVNNFSGFLRALLNVGQTVIRSNVSTMLLFTITHCSDSDAQSFLHSRCHYLLFLLLKAHFTQVSSLLLIYPYWFFFLIKLHPHQPIT